MDKTSMRGKLGYDDLLGSGLAEPEWRYVEVDATILASGFVAPRAITWRDGRRFEVERVTMCQRHGPDQTWYYEVLIRGRKKQLWYRHGAFFVLVERTSGTLHGQEPPELDAYELRKRYGYRA